MRNERLWVAVLARAFSVSCLIRRLWFSCLCKWRVHCPHFGAGGWLSRGARDRIVRLSLSPRYAYHSSRLRWSGCRAIPLVVLKDISAYVTTDYVSVNCA